MSALLGVQLPQNQYGWYTEDTIDCIAGADLPDTKQTFLDIVIIDEFIIQQWIIMAFSMIVNFGVVYYHTTTPVHAKYALRAFRRWCMHFHVIAGLIEIAAGFGIWFVPGDLIEIIAYVQCASSFVHCITAYLQTPIVFGVQAFMVPAYGFVVTVKLLCAINLALNPLCYMRSLVLFNILSIYAWVRVFIATFLKLKLFMGTHYSVAILCAGAICLPGAGPAIVLIGILFIFVYIVLLRLIYGEKSYYFLHQLSENNHNPFGNSSFKTLFQGAAGGCPFVVGESEESEMEADQEKLIDSYLRPLFHNLDSSGNGVVTIEEMKEFALNVKEPKLYQLLHEQFDKGQVVKSPVDQADGIDYVAFRKLAKGTAYSHGVSGLKERMQEIENLSGDNKLQDEYKSKLVFDVFNKDGKGYLTVSELGMVLLEFGLPASEVRLLFRMFDTNHDGKLEFDEFKKNFKPLWKFAYGEFARTFKQEIAQSIRRKKYEDLISTELMQTATDYRREVEFEQQRKSAKSMKLKKVVDNESEEALPVIPNVPATTDDLPESL